MSIVFLTGKRAVCCSLLVMNGGGAFRFRSFVVTEATTQEASLRSARTAFACSSLAIATVSPAFFSSFASNSGGAAAASRANRFQYSSGTNCSISRSRSHTSFNATDCTRPALRPRRTLSHSKGLIL